MRYPKVPRGPKSLQELVSYVDKGTFNGLELSDPVVQLNDSFIATMPEPNGDMF